MLEIIGAIWIVCSIIVLGALISTRHLRAKSGSNDTEKSSEDIDIIYIYAVILGPFTVGLILGEISHLVEKLAKPKD